MATSSFKSTSRRGTTTSGNSNTSSSNSNNPSKLPARRRSLSVSAVSRTTQLTQLEIPSDFCNKRDNPLFSTSNSPPSAANVNGRSLPEEKNVVTVKKQDLGTTRKALGTSGAELRGRSVTRSSDVKKGIGRSLSRVRGRSVSRGHYGSTLYESDKEREPVMSTNVRNSIELPPQAGRTIRETSSVKTRPDTQTWTKNSRISSRSQATEFSEDDSACSMHISNWEDEISTASLSETEEKTVKAVCEQITSDDRGDSATTNGIYETVRSEVRRAISDILIDSENTIRRSNTVNNGTTGISDIPPDLVNPGAVELVLDIRREYAKKLEESEERARKLRADLAVEEHRGHELSRILKETLPESKLPLKDRPGRRRSNERKKMSKRLTEEAMVYFDECVSISTFDSSDFSAPEDPPSGSIGALTNPGGITPLKRENLGRLSTFSPENHPRHKQAFGGNNQLAQSFADSALTPNSCSGELTVNQVSQGDDNARRRLDFFFAHKSTERGPDQDLRSYIKCFERATNDDVNDIDLEHYSRYYDYGEYTTQGQTESLLFDKVLFSSRIESGSLHLCGGAVAVSCFPFGSVL